MLAHASGGERILSSGVDAHAVHIDFGCLRSVHGSHHDVGRELFAGVERCLLGNHKGIELVHTDILQVDVRHQRVKHLALGIAHVALYLRKQRDGSGHGHSLEHIFLPVLTHGMSILRQFRGQVAADYLFLVLVGDVFQNALAERVDGIVECLSLSCSGCQHHLRGSLQVFFVLYVFQVAVGSVGFVHNLFLELLGEVEERVAHLLHQRSLFEPLLHLSGILLHLGFKVTVDGRVLLRGVCRGAVQAFFHQREALEHLGGHVERQHCHEDDVHQVDHLLAWRYRSFLYCHNFITLCFNH